MHCCRVRRLRVAPDALVFRYAVALVGVYMALISTLAAASPEPKRILMLDSFGRDFAPWNEYEKDFRAELDKQVDVPFDTYEMSLATARFADENADGPFVKYLQTLFGQHRLDLVVTVGAPAAAFFQKYRRLISPTTPMLLMALEERRVPLVSLTRNDTVVPIKIDLTNVIGNILHILPATNNVVIVLGNSPIEQYWAGQLRDAILPYRNRVAFTWYNELPFEEMLKRSAMLPPRSAIFFGLLSVDAAGVAQEEGKAFDRLHAAANAPMFSYVDAYFGRGIVGGPLVSVAEASRQAATIALRLLHGERPGDIRIEPVASGMPRYDWRQLRRWNISETDLPANSVVEFRKPTILEQFKWYIVVAVAIVLLETAFIAALLLNRRRLEREQSERERAEGAAREFSGRLISAQEDERSRLARELHDDVTQRLALLAIEAGRAGNVTAEKDGGDHMRNMRESLVSLSEDVHALSYRLHPSILDDLGLVEALRSECEHFSRLESIPVDVKMQDDLAAPSRDVALCLFRIVQEALRNIGRHAGAKHAEVSLRRRGDALQLSVRDDGTGFDPEQHRDRPSLGLASMQQRIYLIGGELNIESAIGYGTIVLASVPLREQQREAPARIVG